MCEAAKRLFVLEDGTKIILQKLFYSFSLSNPFVDNNIIRFQLGAKAVIFIFLD